MDNILNPTKLKEQYIKWLEDEITLNKINEYWEITSPFLDRYNDYLQVYAKMDNDNEILLTDDAYTLNNLKMAGVDINSPRRKQLLDNFLNKSSNKASRLMCVTEQIKWRRGSKL